MRKLLLASAAAVVVSSGAFAADLPARGAAVAPAPVFVAMNWAGFYIGAQVGYSWGDAKGTASPVPPPNTLGVKPDGIVGGLHAGYNLQSGSFVYGLEADIEAAGTRKTQLFALLGATAGFKSDWRGSLRVRAGIAAGSNMLVYLTGGLAVADGSFRIGPPAPGVFTGSSTMLGWTVGAGAEYKFAPNWSARLEYRYSDFGADTFAMPAAFAPATSLRVKYNDHAVRVGVSYYFGGPAGAVVAKY